jgi:hypothetical protein
VDVHPRRPRSTYVPQWRYNLRFWYLSRCLLTFFLIFILIFFSLEILFVSWFHSPCLLLICSEHLEKRVWDKSISDVGNCSPRYFHSICVWRGVLCLFGGLGINMKFSEKKAIDLNDFYMFGSGMIAIKLSGLN